MAGPTPVLPLTSDRARVLSSPTQSAPIWSPRSPRWILEFFRAQANVAVEGGAYQVNQVEDEENGLQIHAAPLLNLSSKTLRADRSHDKDMIEKNTMVATSVGLYAAEPRRIDLQAVQSIVKIANRVPVLYSDNHDQLQSQLNVASEFIYETVENLVFNHPEYGLLQEKNIPERMRFKTDGVATPDVLDELLARAWRRPDLFVMHPETLAEFRKQANASQLTLETVDVFGSPFTAWRGLPIVPSNKLSLRSSSTEARPMSRVPAATGTSILLMRLGESKQGVVHLSAKGTETGPRLPGINVEYMGLEDNAVAKYLLTTYTAVAVLSAGGLARADVTFGAKGS
jgi:hypothetical protein